MPTGGSNCSSHSDRGYGDVSGGFGIPTPPPPSLLRTDGGGGFGSHWSDGGFGIGGGIVATGSAGGDRSSRQREDTCLPRCLSRLTIFASLASLAFLIVSITTDRWVCTTEPIPTLNATEETCYLVTFESGLWRTCATVNWTNTSNTMRVAHSLGKCVAIPLFLTEMNSSFWKAATFSGAFLSEMRLSTPFVVASVLLLGMALLTSLIGHCLQDISTLLAAIFLILAGLSLGGGLIIYIASLSSVYEEYAYFRKSIIGVRLYYAYGPSFYGACASLVLQEFSALLALSAYLKRFRSDEELLKLVPGSERRLLRDRLESEAMVADVRARHHNHHHHHQHDVNHRYSKVAVSLGKDESMRTLKEDLTSDTLTQIECVTVAL